VTGGILPRGASTAALPLVLTAGFLSIALQRLSLSLLGGQISLAAVVLVITWVVLVLAHRWPISRPGLGAYLVVLVLAVGATLLNTVRDVGMAPSLPSLLLVFTTYLPLVLAVRPQGMVAAGWSYARGVVWAVRLGALLAIAQAALQWLGQPFWDPFADIVPTALQTAGFNERYLTTDVDVNLGLGVKPNGVLFLEPSFVSLYCALALVLEAYRVHDLRVRGAAALRTACWMGVLVVALAVSISSSGFVVLGLALAPLLWRYRDRLELVLGVGVLLTAVSFTGFFGPLIEKLSEGTSGNTSTNLRLALPYQTLTPFVRESPLLGFGAGNADSLVGRVGVEALQSPTLLKGALEYGVPFMAVLVGIVVARTLAGGRGYLGLGVAMLGLWLLPSEALLSASTVALLVFMVPNLARPEPSEAARAQVAGPEGAHTAPPAAAPVP
jgi:hypothetical protein